MAVARALGIDVGSTTTKVALVDVEGDDVVEMAGGAATTPATAPELLAVVLGLVGEVLTAVPGAVDAVGVASMAETGVPVDAGGEPLTALLRWDGARDQEQTRRLALRAAEIFAATGVRVSGKTPLATWAWLAAEHGEVRARMRTWMGVADLVAHWLTGDAVTDHTLAGRSGGYRLPGQGGLGATFDRELLAPAGMTPDRLPRVAGPQEVAGVVGAGAGASAAVSVGLPRGTPVVVAGHDHQVGAWAAGVRRPGHAVDSLGTAEAVMSVLDVTPEPERVRQQGMSLVRTVSGAWPAVLAGSAGAGAMLATWLQRLPVSEREPALAAAAARSLGGTAPTGAAVAPYLRGRQTPAPDPTARAGQPPQAWDTADQVRAVVEGICLQARWMLREQRGGYPAEVTVISPDRLPAVWRQMKWASMPTRTRWVEAAEPVAAGAAVLALVRAGVLGEPATAIERAPVLRSHVEPAIRGDVWRPALEEFVARVTGRP